MMRLVLVHGVGAPPRVEPLRDDWVEALAKGMLAAGHDDVADRLLMGAIDVAVPHYAPLFTRRGAQGRTDAEPDELEAQLLYDLAVELIEGMETRSLDSHDQALINRAKTQANPSGRPQGLGAVARAAVNALTTLAGVRWWAGLGRWASDRLLLSDLRQVTRYLRRGEVDDAGHTLDERIRRLVGEAIGSGPAVVVAHSLGTVVALEALHESAAPVSLLVTCGSPLAMRTVVLPRLRPKPATTPSIVARWLNVWDKDDPVVARPRLKGVIRPNDAGVGPKDYPIQSVGSWVHPVRLYLEQPGLAGPVARELRRAPPD
jgi:hypothetical protein